ncbi:MAG: TonB-dependent receptor, partial [Saprospiraceae bacterium]|nr:TonB-dependent receptor [Saprospiraceae bacterium]
SWAQVGNVTINPYSTNLTYSLKQSHLGYTLASFSSAGGNNGRIPNPNLQPLTSTELEFGLDLRFLGNRLGVDITYYNAKTTEDILNATISRTSGFGRTTVNLGEMKNSGIELLITGNPIRGDLRWDVSFNIAKNDNEVVSLIEGTDELVVEEPRTRTVFTKHIVGYPYGMITGLIQKRSPNGQLVFDANNGSPIQSDGYEILGNGIADWTGGINNAFSYKNFNLDFLIDFKIGGEIYSGTNVRLTQTGLTEVTLQGREGQDPISVEGVTQTGTNSDGSPVYEPFSKTLTPSEAQAYWGNTGSRVQDFFTYDASFVKFRQLSIGYNFPTSMLQNTPIRNLRVSFVGRNLAILHKNTPNIDPESSYNNRNGGQGLDYFGFPATRSYGFDVKVDF